MSLILAIFIKGMGVLATSVMAYFILSSLKGKARSEKAFLIFSASLSLVVIYNLIFN